MENKTKPRLKREETKMKKRTTKLWNNIQEELKDNIFNRKILNQFIGAFYDKIIINLPDE